VLLNKFYAENMKTVSTSACKIFTAPQQNIYFNMEGTFIIKLIELLINETFLKVIFFFTDYYYLICQFNLRYQVIL